MSVDERWVEVEGWDRYEVPNYGRIRVSPRTILVLIRHPLNEI